MALLLLRWLLLAATSAAAVAATVAQAQPLASRTDLLALYSLRASLGLRARDWPLKADPCARWAGVDCAAGRVVGVTVAGLRRTRLAATALAPPGLALEGLRNLTALARFNASGFALPGEIPPWFGAGLPAPLAVLDLTSAAVNGTLPPDLGASGNLTALLLAGNRLTGAVPPALLSVAGLRVLDLSRNNLTGALLNVSVPVSLGAGGGAEANGSLSVFNVSGNSLYGVAAGAIAALRRRFQVVDVSGNYLDGAWNGSDTGVLATTNCFYGVPGQRSRGDCEEFYRKQGIKLVDAPAPSLVPLPQPPPSPSPEKKKKQRISKNVLIGVLVAAGTLMALFFVALLLCFVKRRSRGTGGGRGRGVEPNEEGTGTRSVSARRRDSSVNPVVLSPSAVSPSANGEPKDASAVFGELTYEQLVLATGGFGDDKLIKHGHSGDIYHGVLENGSHVIVKKVGAKGVNRHASELDFYTRYSHERIVPLLAHLSNDDEEFMAYKYMPKGDLTNALHKKPADTADSLLSLDWITRLKIATGVAEAMCFLHDECSPPLVHRDIQSSSVLLDDKYEVRLGSMSDICIQQSGGSQNVFTRILRSSKSLDKHTAGPPATCSYDVLCFGKVLLELVTGNFGISGSNDAASEEWLSNTLNHINGGDRASISSIMDPLLQVEEDHLEEVWAVAIIAKTCLSAKPSRRPSARYVLRALESPLRVVRQGSSRSSSARQQLRSSSSRSSWQSVFQGNNHRVQSLDGAAAAASASSALDRRHSLRSHGSGGEASFSFKRDAVPTDAAPEPPAAAVLDEDAVVV